MFKFIFFFFSSRRRHTRYIGDWSSDVCSSDLVLGGAEKLSEADWRERKMMPLFGYIETDEARPLIRLSCQARAEGPVSVVIPPWNGYFGKYLKSPKEGESQETG